MPHKYDAASIKIIRWGTVSQQPNGRWFTSWDIEAEAIDETRVDEVGAASTDSVAGFAPRFTVFSETALTVTVETVRWAMEVDYYALTYKLFKMIDALLGRISFIQGIPRGNWMPFREE